MNAPRPATARELHIATWAAHHWADERDLAWARRALQDAGDLPAGPALVLGGGPCADIAVVPAGREVFALELDPGLLAVARGIAGGATMVPRVGRAGMVGSAPVRCADALRRRLAATTLVQGDAQRPPFAAGSFAIVVALNLLDSTPDPEALLGQCEALLKPAGALLLASPYSWRDDITPVERRLDAALGHPEALEHAIECMVTGAWDGRFMATMRLQWSDRAVPWALRVHDRMTAHYTLHAMLLRKAETPG